MLLNLINDILDLSKIEAGQLEIAWQPFNISTALEGAAQLVRMQAEARGIDLVASAPCHSSSWATRCACAR